MTLLTVLTLLFREKTFPVQKYLSKNFSFLVSLLPNPKGGTKAGHYFHLL